MREILFRAKTKDGKEWLEGYFTKLNENSVIILKEAADCYNKDIGKILKAHDLILVDPETVCQYTGLSDKNGRKIFEGDICEFSAYGENYKGDVRFVKGNFTIWCGKCAPFLDDALEKHSAVVIGNIFDNSELIGDQP